MSESVVTARSEPKTFAPIERVTYENRYEKNAIKITPSGKNIRIEVTAYGVTVGFVMSQPSAHMLFEGGTSIAEEIANPDMAQVIGRGEAKGAGQ